MKISSLDEGSKVPLFKGGFRGIFLGITSIGITQNWTKVTMLKIPLPPLERGTQSYNNPANCIADFNACSSFSSVSTNGNRKPPQSKPCNRNAVLIGAGLELVGGNNASTTGNNCR